jgi:hypothetical protein
MSSYKTVSELQYDALGQLVKKKLGAKPSASRMAAMLPNSFVIRIKNTVTWKDSDDIKSRPVFAKNIKGLWIIDP